MSQCPDCRNEFVQPFVCTTCGAQRLYDATVTSAYDEIERLRSVLRELMAQEPEHCACGTENCELMREPWDKARAALLGEPREEARIEREKQP